MERVDGDEATLGTHNRGARPLPGEALYEECAAILSMSAESSWITFVLDDAGLLRKCQAAKKGCVDDCSVGVSIAAWRFGGTP